MQGQSTKKRYHGRAALTEAKFWALGVRTEDGCLDWPRSRNNRGYGQVRHAHKTMLTHRVAWEYANGPIPDGLNVLHRCDRPSCYEPSHLFVGSLRDNTRDMLNKGRQWLQIAPERALRGAAHGNAVLTDDAVRDIRRRRDNGETLKAIAEAYGIHLSNVWLIVKRKHWKHVA